MIWYHDWQAVCPDLGPNYLQRLSSDDKIFRLQGEFNQSPGINIIDKHSTDWLYQVGIMRAWLINLNFIHI